MLNVWPIYLHLVSPQPKSVNFLFELGRPAKALDDAGRNREIVTWDLLAWLKFRMAKNGHSWKGHTFSKALFVVSILNFGGIRFFFPLFFCCYHGDAWGMGFVKAQK